MSSVVTWTLQTIANTARTPAEQSSGEQDHGLAEYPELFVLRHGETEWNVEGRFQGRRDSSLTARGKSQALKQKDLLSKLGDMPTTAHVSPQGRAVQTAKLALPSTVNLLIDDRLQEIDFGEWEGTMREEIKGQIDCPFESDLWSFRSPGGEDFEMISDRVRAFLNELSKPSIVITHGVTSKVLRGLWLGLGQTDLLRLPKDQGCIFRLSNGAENILR